MKAHYYQTKIIDGIPKKIYKLVVHQFSMGDVEDPDLYAAEPLHKWEYSEAGQYVMEKAIEKPEWHRQINMLTYGYEYYITAQLFEEDATYFTLRFT